MEYNHHSHSRRAQYNTDYNTENNTEEIRQGASRKRAGNSARRAKFRRIIILAIAEILVLFGIFTYAYVLKQYNKIQRPEVNIEEIKNSNLSLESLRKMDEGYWNFAVFGVDSRDSSVGRGANSDVIIICSINRANGDIRLVSVFRDTYLKTDKESYNKINAAYCNGGPEQALKALNENLDLNITQYVTFNWKAVATSINILGGVDVELSKAEFHYINSYITETVKATGIGSVQLTHAGMNHLDGVQAVAYARLRYMDNDYARTERQRKIIQLCLDKAKQTDVKTLNNMIGVVLELVATNMTWQDGLDAVANISNYKIAETMGFPAARGEVNIGKYGACVIPQTLESNVKQLHEFLFAEADYQPSDGVKNISAKIAATSGMYNEGKAIGHVSTEGIINDTSGKSEKKDTEEKASDSEGKASDSDGKKDNKLTKAGNDKKEYAIAKDGYLIYVVSIDAKGNKKYDYAYDKNGKKIKMIDYDEDGHVIYLYEVDEDGNFYFDEEPQETKPNGPGQNTEDDDYYGPGGGPGTTPTEGESQPQGPGGGPGTTPTEGESQSQGPGGGPGTTPTESESQPQGPGSGPVVEPPPTN